MVAACVPADPAALVALADAPAALQAVVPARPAVIAPAVAPVADTAAVPLAPVPVAVLVAELRADPGAALPTAVAQRVVAGAAAVVAEQPPLVRSVARAEVRPAVARARSSGGQSSTT